MFGSHLSIAGGMVNALHEARRLKMDCLQVFTANQRQWNPKPPSAADQTEWLAALRQVQWDSMTDGLPPRVVSHNSYLINMASPDAAAWKKSVAAQRAEIERCQALRIPYCVAHPGAHLGTPRKPGSPNDLLSPPSADELAGLKRIIKALDTIHTDLPGSNVITCLETTVGSGTNLGYSFHQLAFIRQNVRQPDRIGFCFDTCHITAAGYDMSAPAAAASVIKEWDAVCGIANLKAFHFNDSVGALGSRRDRHAHIGEGCCGKPCFQTILNHPAFRAVPKLLETPKGLNPRQVEWDLVNIRRLKRLANGEAARSSR